MCLYGKDFFADAPWKAATDSVDTFEDYIILIGISKEDVIGRQVCEWNREWNHDTIKSIQIHFFWFDEFLPFFLQKRMQFSSPFLRFFVKPKAKTAPTHKEVHEYIEGANCYLVPS